MKQIVNGIAIGLITLLAMAASLFVSRLIWLGFHHHYREMPQGYGHGQISMKVMNWGPNEGDVELVGVPIGARSESAWTWSPPKRIHYRKLRLEGSPSRLELTVDAVEGTYQLGETTGPLTPEVLARWMTRTAAGSKQAHVRETADWLIAVIAAANMGTLPPPRHHLHGNDSFAEQLSIPVPDDAHVTLLHGLSRIGFWWLDGVFLASIPATVMWFVRRRTRRAEQLTDLS
ncbi:MAG TPA: hypothetical protein DCY13_13280 [Verrucomicrobiales bacterium]|jgi:hypothetical protein|nr:hypothetical protein [Verrucomicrobiales bacterium]